MNFEAYTNPHTPRLLVHGDGCLKSIPNPDYISEEEANLLRFKETALYELGLSNHPKKEEIWDFALLHGAEHGMRWIYHYLERVSYFIK